MATAQPRDEEKTKSTSRPANKKTKFTQGEGEDNGSSDISSDEEGIDSKYFYERPLLEEESDYNSSDEDRESPDFIAYMKVMQETNGYVIPDKPKGLKICFWRPLRVTNLHKTEVVDLAKSCLNWFMDNTTEAKGRYEFLAVKHANKIAARGIYYYMVFAARDLSTGNQEIFKARALSAIMDEDDTIEGCELAPELASYC